jgi:hypothetical protein
MQRRLIIRTLELDDIKRSLESVIQPNRTSVPQIVTTGAAVVRVIRTTDVPIQDAVTDIWHAVVQMEIRYFIAATT